MEIPHTVMIVIGKKRVGVCGMRQKSNFSGAQGPKHAQCWHGMPKPNQTWCGPMNEVRSTSHVSSEGREA